MIQTWMADVTALHDEKRYAQYYRGVPDFRKRKADRLRLQRDRALSVGVWSLLETMKKEYGLSENLSYNLSHSGDFVLCSVEDDYTSDCRVGCDIEQISELRMQVAERFFCQSEYATILACSTEMQAEQFYRLWVLKESFMKATRMGMKLDMRAFEIGFDKGEKPCLKRKPDCFFEEYQFREYLVEGVPYRIAVCADTDKFASKIHLVEL